MEPSSPSKASQTNTFLQTSIDGRRRSIPENIFPRRFQLGNIINSPCKLVNNGIASKNFNQISKTPALPKIKNCMEFEGTIPEFNNLQFKEPESVKPEFTLFRDILNSKSESIIVRKKKKNNTFNAPKNNLIESEGNKLSFSTDEDFKNLKDLTNLKPIIGKRRNTINNLTVRDINKNKVNKKLELKGFLDFCIDEEEELNEMNQNLAEEIACNNIKSKNSKSNKHSSSKHNLHKLLNEVDLPNKKLSIKENELESYKINKKKFQLPDFLPKLNTNTAFKFNNILTSNIGDSLVDDFLVEDLSSPLKTDTDILNISFNKAKKKKAFSKNNKSFEEKLANKLKTRVLFQ